MKPTIGRIVHYRVATTGCETSGCANNNAEILPAVIVRVWNETCVNLKVLTDGPNDIWKTSVGQGDGVNQWSWPPRELASEPAIAPTSESLNSTGPASD